MLVVKLFLESLVALTLTGVLCSIRGTEYVENDNVQVS